MHRDPWRSVARDAFRALSAVCLGALAMGCATTAEYRALERDVRELRATRGQSGSAAVEAADLGVRLDEIEARLNEIQGYMEQVNHRSERALEEATAARSDAAEARGDADTARREAAEATRALSEAKSTSPQSALPAAPTTVAIAPTPSPDPALSIPGAPTPDPNSSVIPVEPGAGSPGGTGVIEAYRSAYAAWRNDDTQACIDQFRQFLQTNASSPFADDASYWMADCYFKQGDYKTAILRFDDVVSRYPGGNKAADALYRQGEALLRLGPGYTKAAGKAFERVLKEYPASDRAIEARRQLEILGTG